MCNCDLVYKRHALHIHDTTYTTHIYMYILTGKIQCVTGETHVQTDADHLPVAKMCHEGVGCCAHMCAFRAQNSLEKPLSAEQRFKLDHHL